MLMSKITRCDIDCRMIDLPSTWTMPWSYFWIGEDDQFPWVKRYGPGQTRRRDRLSVAISTGSQSSLQNNPSQRQSQWCDRSILTHNIYSLGLINAHFAGDEEFVQNSTVRSYIFALLFLQHVTCPFALPLIWREFNGAILQFEHQIDSSSKRARRVIAIRSLVVLPS